MMKVKCENNPKLVDLGLLVLNNPCSFCFNLLKIKHLNLDIDFCVMIQQIK